MILIEMVGWWYARGWGIFVRKAGGFLKSITNFFSMSSLLRTLFKPFRQISADSAGSGASVDIKFHLFIDRLVSRVIGFFSRLILIVVGLILIVVGGLFCLVVILAWPFIPFIPVAGIVMSVMGVMV
ncbi:hypothetical protein IKE72_02220 [Candidatus Saccharibacteria bacterium]|nr:hypothetical protein [Candidatus Saccharibacteria bacterium]